MVRFEQQHYNLLRGQNREMCWKGMFRGERYPDRVQGIVQREEKRRIYRFAAEDGGVRDDWMRALIQTVQPQGIQDLPLDQEIQFAGQIYARQKNSSWYLGWMTLIGHVLRIENLTCRSSLVVDMGQVFMVYTHHKGKCKALDLSPSDSKILEDNQRTEVLVDDRILMLQGIMLRDTEKIFTLLDELVKARWYGASKSNTWGLN